MPARLEFELPLGKPAAAQHTPRRNEPMRLLLLGDFSGTSAASAAPLAERPTLRVDLDNFDQVMQRLAPGVQVPLGGKDFALSPRTLEDFHPDQLLNQLPPLSQARDLRARLAHPSTFARAAAELGLPVQGAGVAPAAAAAPAAATDLLGSLLGGRPAAAPPAAPRTAAAGIDQLLRGIVAPHVVADAPAQQTQYLAAADAALAEQLRAVLHTPALQALEAAWRGAFWLVSNLELDDGLQLHLLDVRREDIQADLVAAQGRVQAGGLYQALVGRARGQPGAERWAALVPLFGFGAGDADIAVLAALGLLAAQAGAPLLAGVGPGVLGWASFAQAGRDAAAATPGWQQLRRSEAAPWINAAAPRLLMRLPYGKGLETVESLAFEEFPGPPEHEQLLWASGALAPALMLGRAYTADGWQGEPDEQRNIDGLPACVFTRDGERHLQPCAEVLLGDSAADALRAGGLTALLSHSRSAEVQVAPLRSMAEPATTVAGLMNR
jgi:type VI secretion system protein ImpC